VGQDGILRAACLPALPEIESLDWSFGMKTLLLFSVYAAVSLAAQPAPQAPSGAVAAPPAGAVEFAPGSFRYTDAQGKKWIYRRTPFGVARLEDAAAPPAPLSAAARKSLDAVRATEAGDSIRFERATPFGVQTWQTRKADLDEMEQAVWNRQCGRDAK